MKDGNSLEGFCYYFISHHTNPLIKTCLKVILTLIHIRTVLPDVNRKVFDVVFNNSSNFGLNCCPLKYTDLRRFGNPFHRT